MSAPPERRPAVCMVGSSNTDLVARIDRFPTLGESLTGSDFSIGFGGKGANQAVMAARLGARVTVVTRLGRDAFGDAYLAHYRDEGVDVSGVARDDEAASGVTSIWVEAASGLNTMAYVPGANGRLSPADVRAAAGAIAAGLAVFSLLLSDFFDTIGTVTGLAAQADLLGAYAFGTQALEYTAMAPEQRIQATYGQCAGFFKVSR